MGGVDNGLTLEGLAQRLEEQGRENAERLNALERENARLRDEVAAFRGSDTGREEVGGALRTRSAPRADNGAEDGGSQATQVPEGRMDRRRLLKGAAAAAASLVVAGSLTQRDIREAKADAQFRVFYDEEGWGAIEGYNNLGYGVRGHGYQHGIHGESVFGEGVYGRSEGGFGVAGVTNTNSGYGVAGSNLSENGTGVSGQGLGGGIGVKGQSPSIGVSGEGPPNSDGGGVPHIGVRGLSAKGIGGVFGGGRAQLKLNPNATTGRPTGGHEAGELFMNSTCELFICTRSGGVAATWRKVQTVPAF